MPFCSASRVTMPINGCAGAICICGGRDQQFLVGALAAQILRRVMRREMGIVPRIPLPIIDAVQYPGHSILARPQGALHTHAERRIANFARVGRADRGDADPQTLFLFSRS